MKIAAAPEVFIGSDPVVRTALEDRMLYRELPGYPEYVNRVPFRLIPGVW